jgi:UDP-N-acetylmuramyl pentapeptide phosphotransferase/UDP-N-acetylglucosamine-1-phosphate transferase
MRPADGEPAVSAGPQSARRISASKLTSLRRRSARRLDDNDIARNVMANGQKLLLILLGELAMVAIGILDDVRGMRARWKFAVQFPVAMALVGSVVSELPDLGLWEFKFDSLGRPV